MMKGRCRMLTSRLLILNQKEAECKEMAAYFQDRQSKINNQELKIKK